MTNATIQRPTLRMVMAMVIVMGAIGCSRSEQGKQGLFEDDHYVPPHWPTDSEDLVRKLTVHLDAFDAGQVEGAAGGELADLIGWTPEIMADTEIDEETWNHVYAQCEAFKITRRSGTVVWTAEQLAGLREMITELDAINRILADKRQTLAAQKLDEAADSNSEIQDQVVPSDE